MSKYILKRLLLSIITIWAVITITFVLMNAIPGNPFANENRRIPENIYENLMKKYGLDKPKSEQYITYLKNIAKFDFGESMRSDTETVNEMINRGFPVSATLGFEALIISLIFGPALGAIAALYQNKAPDYISMIISIIGVSVPSFLMGTFLIQFVATKFDWIPIGGWGEFRHTILPSITLAMMPLAQISRLMRSGMLEVLNQDYLKTARSKGLAGSVVIMKHAVRNAILPIISILGTTISDLLTGSFVVEKIFGIPGMGMFFINSVFNRDYTLIMGVAVFYAIVLIIMMLLVDIAYTLVDPRIRLAKGGH
ncbi:MAG TPA: ABC transporter permease [Clostridia bacterium]|nr:ABC transporter permease [Clostridia bacterium]